ncbi:MAG: chloride channel protein [Polyangiales bacterium]
MRKRLATLTQWTALGALVGVVCGVASALFLALLDRATGFRTGHERVVFLLPLAGLALGAVYERLGQPIKGGSNLVIDAIHDDGPEIPLRMAPMVLFGTVLTHLFGGSAGREGTAVQMGASLTDWLSHRLRLDRATRRRMLAAGVAGGFGSVFGTPVAGAVFGLEFVVLGRVEYDALIPALIASVIGDLVTRALGITHTPYPTVAALALTPWVIAKWLVFAAAVAATSAAFIELTHAIKKRGEALVPRLPVRMMLGGLAVIALWKLTGTSEYLGLGVPTIVRAFDAPPIAPWAFALKLLFTAVTLGAGFLGGEVTPLFFVGAALGATLSSALHLPLALSAAVGMAAVFGCASNAPIALSIMAVELMGAHVLPHVLIVCAVSYVLSGHRSIYPSQRLVREKTGSLLAEPTAVRDAHTRAKSNDESRTAQPENE